MPDRLVPLLATNCLASATVIMFAMHNKTYTRSTPPHTRVTEPFLVSLSDNLPVWKHPIILYIVDICAHKQNKKDTSKMQYVTAEPFLRKTMSRSV
jgi:hypothetical protein